MPLQLKNVVPWGRNLDEYIRMFDLSSSHQKLSILDCAGGPASFNIQMTELGGKVISCDPIYQFSAAEIAQRIEETYPQIVDGVTASYDCYVWQEIKSPAHLGEVRMSAMNQFLQDFPTGKKTGRYINAQLPNLPFNNQQFDLTLVSHLLFTYSEHLSVEFHIASILELCRIAKQVRIFPLLNICGKVSPFLEPVLQMCKNQAYQVEIRTVPYEFQKNGNQMMQIQPQ